MAGSPRSSNTSVAVLVAEGVWVCLCISRCWSCIASRKISHMMISASTQPAGEFHAQPLMPISMAVVLGKLKADETLCTLCHLSGFAGQNEITRLAGQPFDCIVKLWPISRPASAATMPAT